MLTTEQQKRLTEFLGECWHEFSTHPIHRGAIQCHNPECNLHEKVLVTRVGIPQTRLDFTDWRVVGRLIEKCHGEYEALHLLSYTSMAGERFLARYHGRERFSSESMQEAICLAICAYLEEREGK